MSNRPGFLNPVTTATVLTMKMCSRSNSATARRTWLGSSWLTIRTITLVSTASMSFAHSLGDGFFHLFQ